MAEKIIDQIQYIIQGKPVYVTFDKKTAEANDITVFDEDGEIIFSGDKKQSRDVFEILDQLAGEETI